MKDHLRNPKILLPILSRCFKQHFNHEIRSFIEHHPRIWSPPKGHVETWMLENLGRALALACTSTIGKSTHCNLMISNVLYGYNSRHNQFTDGICLICQLWYEQTWKMRHDLSHVFLELHGGAVATKVPAGAACIASFYLRSMRFLVADHGEDMVVHLKSGSYYCSQFV